MCHVCVSSASGCALGNFTEHAAWNTAVQELYFHPAGPEARKSGSDAAGTAVLFKVLYCKIKNVFFIFMYNLGEKWCKPLTVHCYIASCVSWVPRLTLLDF